jgi:hypothetical protein
MTPHVAGYCTVKLIAVLVYVLRALVLLLWVTCSLLVVDLLLLAWSPVSVVAVALSYLGINARAEGNKEKAEEEEEEEEEESEKVDNNDNTDKDDDITNIIARNTNETMWEIFALVL